jgi:hypothetical protein
MMTNIRELAKGEYICTTCRRIKAGRRWEHGPRTYCSVLCAERDGWNPITQRQTRGWVFVRKGAQA